MDTSGGRVSALRQWLAAGAAIVLALVLLSTQPPTASATTATATHPAPTGASGRSASSLRGAGAPTPQDELLAAVTPARTPPPDPRAVEVELIADLNRLRVERGLAPLAEDRPDLTELARSWAAHLAADGRISHRPDLREAAPSDWIHLGENVGVGASAQQLHDAFVASPAHLRNLVDPDFRSVAVGAVVVGDRVWVTQNFLRAAP